MKKNKSNMKRQLVVSFLTVFTITATFTACEENSDNSKPQRVDKKTCDGDYKDRSKNLREEHPSCVAASANRASDDYVPRL